MEKTSIKFVIRANKRRFPKKVQKLSQLLSVIPKLNGLHVNTKVQLTPQKLKSHVLMVNLLSTLGRLRKKKFEMKEMKNWDRKFELQK